MHEYARAPLVRDSLLVRVCESILVSKKRKKNLAYQNAESFHWSQHDNGFGRNCSSFVPSNNYHPVPPKYWKIKTIIHAHAITTIPRTRTRVQTRTWSCITDRGRPPKRWTLNIKRVLGCWHVRGRKSVKNKDILAQRDPDLMTVSCRWDKKVSDGVVSRNHNLPRYAL